MSEHRAYRMPVGIPMAAIRKGDVVDADDEGPPILIRRLTPADMELVRDVGQPVSPETGEDVGEVSDV